MAIHSTMGLKKIYFAPANATNNTQMPTQGWRDLGDIYKDTCTFVDGDPTKTEHISETSARRIVQKSKVAGTLTLSIMDPSLELLSELCGGEISTVNGKRTWTESYTTNNNEYAFLVYPEVGMCLKISAATVTAKKNTTYSSAGITLLELQIDPVTSISYSEDEGLPNLDEDGDNEPLPEAKF